MSGAAPGPPLFQFPNSRGAVPPGLPVALQQTTLRCLGQRIKAIPAFTESTATAGMGDDAVSAGKAPAPGYLQGRV